MGGLTYLIVADPAWRFDLEETFAALRSAYTGRKFRQWSDLRKLAADGWVVNVHEGGTTFVIQAPPAPQMELVSWVRGFVPDDVALQVFDDQDPEPAPLRPGITPDQVRAEFYPDAWQTEAMSPTERPTAEEVQSMWTKPHHLP